MIYHANISLMILSGPGGKGQNAATALTQFHTSPASTTNTNTDTDTKSKHSTDVSLIMFAASGDSSTTLLNMLESTGIDIISTPTAAALRTCVTLISPCTNGNDTDGNTDSDKSEYAATEIVGAWGGAISEGKLLGTCVSISDALMCTYSL